MGLLQLPLEFDPVEFRGSTAQTQKLFFEILMDAIGCLLSLRGSRKERPQLSLAARAWFAEDDPDVLVTFTTVCTVLQLPIGRLRALLLGPNPQIHFILDRGHRLRRHAEVPVASIQSLVTQGVAFTEVASRCGVPLRVVREIGTDLRRQRLVQRVAAIRIAVGRGQTIEAVSTQMGVSPATVRRALVF